MLSPAHFVWADGMTDWKVMSEVSDFSVLVTAPAPLDDPLPGHGRLQCALHR